MSDPVYKPPFSICVVIPAYRVVKHIAQVIENIPFFVQHIILVDDACPDGSGAYVESLQDKRVEILYCTTNGGVGAATMMGFHHGAHLGYDILIKIDGDGQMDPAHLSSLLAPLLTEKAAYSKANRFWHINDLNTMPIARKIGNIGLSFLTKFASGHWKIFDPTNGYVAIRTDVWRLLNHKRLQERYFFEISLLIELGALGFQVYDVPLPAYYGDEKSSLSIWKTLCTFPYALFKGTFRRIFIRHFWREFTAVAVLLSTGIPLLLWGLCFGLYSWKASILSEQFTSAGTVMLAGMPFMLGIIFCLHALMLDISGMFVSQTGVYQNPFHTLHLLTNMIPTSEHIGKQHKHIHDEGHKL
jgi:dolichol-phosphate mannosyltransferase